MKRQKAEDISYIVSIFCISVLLCLSILTTKGYHSVLTEDTYAFTSWNWQFYESMRRGIIYPRWMSLDFWGYGSPVFIQYPPLSYYATALLAPVLSSILKSMNFLKFVSFFLSGLGIYLLVKQRFSKDIAFLTALFFISSPFYIFLIYYYGTYAAILSIPIIPLLLKKLYDYSISIEYKDIFVAGFLYGLLIMTHLITAYMLGLIIFTIIIIIHKAPIKSTTAYTAFVVFALLVASPYVLPLACEMDNLSIINFIDKKSGFDFNDFFVIPWKVSLTSAFWNQYNFFFRANLVVYTAILIISIIARIKYRDTVNIDNKYEYALIVAAIFTLVVQMEPSGFIWRLLPFFKYIQFPFRWMIISGLLISLLTAFLFERLRIFLKRDIYFKLFIGFYFIFILLIDHRLISYSHFFPESSVLPPDSVNWTMEHLPKGVDIAHLSNKEDHYEFLAPLNGDFSYKTIRWQPQEKTFRINATTPSLVRLHHFYFPGWKAYLNGNDIKIKLEDKTNAMIVQLPEGLNDLTISFEDTPVRKISKYIFCLTLVLMLLYYMKCRKKLI